MLSPLLFLRLQFFLDFTFSLVTANAALLLSCIHFIIDASCTSLCLSLLQLILRVLVTCPFAGLLLLFCNLKISCLRPPNFVAASKPSCCSCRSFCKHSNMPQNTRNAIGLENYRFTMQNTITEGQAHKHVRKRRQDDRTRTNRTHRVGALPQSHPGLCGRLVVPARTPTVHLCLYGKRPWVAQDTLHATPPKRQDQGLQRHALVTNMVAEPVC